MIHPANWSTDQTKATLGALRAIASLHGTAPLSDAEAQLIEGVRVTLLQHPEITEAEQNFHIKPDELAAIVQDAEHRARVAELLALMPYATRPYSDDKTYISEKFIEAMGENMHRVEDFLGAREKHSQNLEYCALRKMGRDIFDNTDPDFEHAELVKLLKDAEGDPDEVARYQALKDYKDGTLGKAFYQFYEKFDWPLPGDKHWISEDLTVRHDLVHVLCDYDISINGEFCVAGFTAGNSTKFEWMVAMLGFTPPYVSTGQAFQPADFLAAFQRGDAAKPFVETWDFWPEMSEQLGDLRKRLEV